MAKRPGRKPLGPRLFVRNGIIYEISYGLMRYISLRLKPGQHIRDLERALGEMARDFLVASRRCLYRIPPCSSNNKNWKPDAQH